MAHDYLHSWAYRAMAHLEPSMAVMQERITKRNIDRFAYLHLLTEAAAVVGLDYWYLCVKNVNQRCGLGSLLGPQTVQYDERYASEYLRFNPALAVQKSEFFFAIVKLFCIDEFDGFAVEDLCKSPALSAWLRRELLASHSQRRITRSWLSAFGGFTLSKRELYSPLRMPVGRMKVMAHELGALLWKKVKCGEQLFFQRPSTACWWTYKLGQIPDFTITNIFGVKPTLYEWGLSPDSLENFSCYMKQHLSRFRFPERASVRAMTEMQIELQEIQRTCDQERLWKLTSRLVPMGSASEDQAPLEMIFVN